MTLTSWTHMCNQKRYGARYLPISYLDCAKGVPRNSSFSTKYLSSVELSFKTVQLIPSKSLFFRHDLATRAGATMDRPGVFLTPAWAYPFSVSSFLRSLGSASGAAELFESPVIYSALAAGGGASTRLQKKKDSSCLLRIPGDNSYAV